MKNVINNNMAIQTEKISELPAITSTSNLQALVYQSGGSSGLFLLTDKDGKLNPNILNDTFLTVESIEEAITENNKALDLKLETKQNKLTAGTNVSLVNNTISVTIPPTPDGTKTVKGILSVGNSLSVSAGKVSLDDATIKSINDATLAIKDLDTRLKALETVK